jgi:hypothetical protein
MRISSFLLLLLLNSFAAAAGTYKWVDERGVTHYGDRIPAEYTNAGNEQLNRRGIVIKKTEPALTEEQRKAIAEEKLSREIEEKEAIEQKRRDDALLLTYTSVEEIEQKKEREVQQAELAIASLEEHRKSAESQLQAHLKRRAALGSSAPPEHLVYDITSSEQSIARLEQRLSARRFQLSEIQTKYEAQKKRFAELKNAR